MLFVLFSDDDMACRVYLCVRVGGDIFFIFHIASIVVIDVLVSVLRARARAKHNEMNIKHFQ